MSEEKVYQGWRSPDGQEAYVTVNGEPLRHIVFVSPTGMEWGYMGAAPTDLALSILTDHLGDEKKAQKLHRELRRSLLRPGAHDGELPGRRLVDGSVSKFSDISASPCSVRALFMQSRGKRREKGGEKQF